MRHPGILLLGFIVLWTCSATAPAAEFTAAIAGDSMPGWEVKGGPAGAWSIQDGVLANPGGQRRAGWMGTRQGYSDCIIDLEFKISPGGNSGIFLRAPETGHVSATGLEIQILDEQAEKHQGIKPAQACGSVYLIAAPTKKMTRPAGEWNHMRVTADHDHIVVELNGATIVDVDGQSHPELLKRRQTGLIGLQNYGVPVWFRNIKVADLSRGRCKADWITTNESGNPLFRREFHLAAQPKRAVIRIVGLGHFQLRINGQPASAAAIHQPWSQYDKIIFYEQWNITPLLRQGPNAIGVMLGNSFWYNPPAPKGRYNKYGPQTDFGTQYLLRVETDIETEDGKQFRIVSDNGWRATIGPVTFSHVFGGEDYDARLLPAGWDQPGFDAGAWPPAVVAANPPTAKLQPQYWPPIRAKEVFPAVEYVKAGDGLYHVFFEQNAAAVLRFTVLGKAGQRFCVQPSEYLTVQGEFMKPQWGDPALFHYTLQGEGPETHQWLFHYHGFQAIELTGAVPAGEPNPAALPVIQKMELVHVRTDLPEVGHFQTSNSIYNRTHHLIDWAMRSNMSYCPDRLPAS